LDKVQGAAHFAVSDELARSLQNQLLEILPGYLVPKMVREIAGAGSKTPF
jgi:L-lysine 2,3-aminomutase